MKSAIQAGLPAFSFPTFAIGLAAWLFLSSLGSPQGKAQGPPAPTPSYRNTLRYALKEGGFTKFSGEVEADETFIGGKARNMHIRERKRRITGSGPKDKTAVMGILERGGKVRSTVFANRRKHAIQTEVKKNVAAGSALYTDALLSYSGLEREYAHKVIVDHAEAYVNGRGSHERP